MLTCFSHRVRLPQSELAYVAFRLAAEDTLCQLELYRDSDEPFGFLLEVPFLENVVAPVQIELLADLWARHRASELFEASLVDAAVLYAACRTAVRLLEDEAGFARSCLKRGPHRVPGKLPRKTPARLNRLFHVFWDDIDFMALEEFIDLEPDHARRIKRLMGLPDNAMEQMLAVLARYRASPRVVANLQGLLTGDEIRDCAVLLGLKARPAG